MTERLKQIWSGFEDATSRQLTGRGIDNIAPPRRVDYLAEDEECLPQDFHGPAETAFAALRETLAGHEKKFSRGGRRDAAPAPSPEDMLTAPVSFNDDDLIRGLRATALRTERAEYDYSAFMTTDEGKRSVRRYKKKKRFGLF